jgi:NADH:ubiquinone oxidoreductase subunit 3 (subunit A)
MERLALTNRTWPVLKHPGRLTLLLAITGLLPVAFYGAVFLVNIPDNVAYFLFVFAIIPLILFFGLAIYSLVRKTRRDIQKIKTMLTHCQICDEGLSHSGFWDLRRIRRLHYESVHPDVLNWNRKWQLAVYAWFAVTTSLAVLGMTALVFGNILLGLLASAVVAAFILISGRLSKRKLRQFRQAWQDHVKSGS